MDLKEYQSSQTVNRHPWEQSRADFFSYIVRHHLPSQTTHEVLDIGSGDTWLAQRLLSELEPAAKVTCVDSSYTQELIDSLDQHPNVLPTVEIPTDKRFDAAFLFDVIEHVPDDRQFLKNIANQHLNNHGKIVISVPAYQSLFTAHDRWLGHYRRYSPQAGREMVKDCGLKIIDDGSLFHGLLYVRALEKVIEKFNGEREVTGVSHWTKGAALTKTIKLGLNLDWQISEAMRKLRLRLPGLSWWCVCVKA